MAKTNDELNALKKDCEALRIKLKELTEDELKEVGGGSFPAIMPIIYSVSGNDSWPAYFSCKYYCYVASTDPKVGGHTCNGGSIKGTLPACSECPANKYI